jgi:hypothetical protein
LFCRSRQRPIDIVWDYEGLGQRALHRLAVAQQQHQMQSEATWRHKVEPSASGGFIAFWEKNAIYDLARRPRPNAKGYNHQCDRPARKAGCGSFPPRKPHARSWLDVMQLEKSYKKSDPRPFPVC